MRKFLFLDIDGVICCGYGLERCCVDNVKSLLSDFRDLEVVLTSTRRADEDTACKIATILGVDRVLSTPLSNCGNKSEEITEFFKLNRITSCAFVVLDDNKSLFNSHFDALVICNKSQGFQSTELSISRSILNSQI